MVVRVTTNELQPLITCRILLTSPAVRSNDPVAAASSDTMDTSMAGQQLAFVVCLAEIKGAKKKNLSFLLSLNKKYEFELKKEYKISIN